jgi:hypothetical protein
VVEGGRRPPPLAGHSAAQEEKGGSFVVFATGPRTTYVKGAEDASEWLSGSGEDDDDSGG